MSEPRPYFVAEARAEMARMGGDPAHAGPLAEWAQDAREVDDMARGVIVALDGQLVAETRHYRGEGTHVVRDDSTRLGLVHTEVGLACGALRRQLGQPVAHVTMSRVSMGASRFIPEVTDGLPAYQAVRDAVADQAATETRLRDAVRAAHQSGLTSISGLADAAGVARSTIYRWLEEEWT